MEKFECVICSSKQDEQLPKYFVPCVLNCSHMYCLHCIITAIMQFKPPKSNGFADPVADSDKCPLCREYITSILPLSQMISSDQEEAHATIKYFKEIVNSDLNCSDLIDTLRTYRSNICHEMNQLAVNVINADTSKLEKCKALTHYIFKHKLFLGSDFTFNTESKSIKMIGSNMEIFITQ